MQHPFEGAIPAKKLTRRSVLGRMTAVVAGVFGLKGCNPVEEPTNATPERFGEVGRAIERIARRGTIKSVDQNMKMMTITVGYADKTYTVGTEAKFMTWCGKEPKPIEDGIENPSFKPGAKVLIVKFNDFQCPACGQSYLQYKPILAKWEASNPGAVRMVLKDYPLNRDCNDVISQTLHPAACDAAVAVRLARLRNKGEAMEEWLYTHQPAMTPPSVRQAAKDVGGVTDFDERYATTMVSVKSDIALGKQLGIRATPTFFINGVKFDSAILPQYFDAAIAYELQHPPAK